jgi:hypothetical protein
MLRFISGLNPAPRYLHAIAAAFMLASFVLPSAALAASTSFDLIDPLGSGYGVTISLDDSIVPGALSVSLESSGTALPIAELAGINLQYYDGPLFNDLQAVGPDIAKTFTWSVGANNTTLSCPCNLKIDLGTVGLFEMTGITETDFDLVNDQSPITLADFAGSAVTVYLAYPGFASNGTSNSKDVENVSFIKLEGKIPVVPEPTNAVLMLFGLLGLASVPRNRA